MQKLFEGSRRIREAFGVAGFSLWDVTHFGKHVALPGDLKHAQPAMALHVGHTYVVTRHRAQPKHPFASLWVDDGFGPCAKFGQNSVFFSSFHCDESGVITFFGKRGHEVTASTYSYYDTLRALAGLAYATCATHPVNWHDWVGNTQVSSPKTTPRPDDLKRIRGIGVLIERKLHSLGFTTYAQIAAWDTATIEFVRAEFQMQRARIARENWVEQARILATGGQTEFSARIDRERVPTPPPWLHATGYGWQ